MTLGTLAGLVGVTRGQFGSEPPVDLYCGDMNCYEGEKSTLFWASISKR